MTFVLFYHSFIVVSQKQTVHENQEGQHKNGLLNQLFAIRIQGRPRSRVHIMSAMLSSRFYQPAVARRYLISISALKSIKAISQFIHYFFLSSSSKIQLQLPKCSVSFLSQKGVQEGGDGWERKGGGRWLGGRLTDGLV